MNKPTFAKSEQKRARLPHRRKSRKTQGTPRAPRRHQIRRQLARREHEGSAASHRHPPPERREQPRSRRARQGLGIEGGGGQDGVIPFPACVALFGPGECFRDIHRIGNRGMACLGKPRLCNNKHYFCLPPIFISPPD